VLADARGELWFAAHSRAAPEEMRAVADDLQAVMRHLGAGTPDLDDLLGL
jgi:2-dehydropantoate 2-reductase